MNNLITRTQSDEQRLINPLSPAALVAVDRDRALQLVAEWQDRGPETLAGHGLWKLRLSLAPAESVVAATVAG